MTIRGIYWQGQKIFKVKFVEFLWVNGHNGIESTGHSLIRKSDSAAEDEKTVAPKYMEAARESPRHVTLHCVLMSGVTLCLFFVCLGTGWRKLAMEIETDRRWGRLALLDTFPIQSFASMVSTF